VEMSIVVNEGTYTITAKVSSTSCAPGTGEYSYSNVTGRVEGKKCE